MFSSKFSWFISGTALTWYLTGFYGCYIDKLGLLPNKLLEVEEKLGGYCILLKLFVVNGYLRLISFLNCKYELLQVLLLGCYENVSSETV